MRLKETTNDYFIDPISHNRMHNPVINECGHTFESDQLNGWNKNKVTPGAVDSCPLCEAPVRNLVPNMLIRYALEVLDLPDNVNAEKIEDLLDEEQEKVQNAINNVMQRRNADHAKGILDRLPQPKNFIQRTIDGISALSKESKDFYENSCFPEKGKKKDD